MRAVIVRGGLALLLLLAAPVVAQTPRSIEAGETLRVEASANPAASDQVDFYQFVGVMGSRVTLTLDSPNEALLTLYTPRGEEMLYRSGSGPIDIVAVLPLTNTFLVGVTRADTSKPYTLSLSVSPPEDLHAMFFARRIGFSFPRQWDDDPTTYHIRTCWIDPGRRFLRTWPRGTEEFTLGRDGIEYVTLTLNGREPRRLERQVEFDGTTAVYPQLRSDGTTTYHGIELEVDDPSTLGPYEGYFCDEPVPLGSNAGSDAERAPPSLALERERQEAEETARLNREMADFAASQAAANAEALRKAEADRVAYEAALAEADEERVRYERTMDQHRRELEEAERRQRVFAAEQRRHANCVAGNRQACDDIRAGTPVRVE